MAKKDEVLNTEPQAADGSMPVSGTPALRKYQESMKSRYPEEYDPAGGNEPDMLDKYATEMEDTVGRYKESEMTLQEIIDAYPEFAQMLYDIVVNKMPPNVAIAKHFSQEDLIVDENSEDYPGFQSALKERTERAQRNKQTDQEVEANQEASIAAIDAYSAKKGYDDAQRDALLDFINEFFQKLIMKQIGEAELEGFDKMRNHDTNVAEAEKVGELNGKNAAIEIKKAKDATSKSGDGVPAPNKGGGVRQPSDTQKNALFADIKERKSI